MIEDACEEGSHKAVGDSVAEPAGQHLLATVIEVPQRFEMPLADEEGGIALGRRETAPDFRYQQADIVVDLLGRADESRRSRESRQAGQDVRK